MTTRNSVWYRIIILCLVVSLEYLLRLFTALPLLWFVWLANQLSRFTTPQFIPWNLLRHLIWLCVQFIPQSLLFNAFIKSSLSGSAWSIICWQRASLSIRCCAARSERFWTIFMIPSLHPWNARNRSCKVSLFLMNAWRYSFLSTVIIKIAISSIVIGLKNSCFPFSHLPSCYRTVCYRTVRWANHIQSCSLNQPVTTLVSITIKTVYRLLNSGFLQNGEFFPINYDNILEDFVWKLSFFGLIGNKTSRRPTRFVIILRPY